MAVALFPNETFYIFVIKHSLAGILLLIIFKEIKKFWKDKQFDILVCSGK